jgi:hypothetical protein
VNKYHNGVLRDVAESLDGQTDRQAADRVVYNLPAAKDVISLSLGGRTLGKK